MSAIRAVHPPAAPGPETGSERPPAGVRVGVAVTSLLAPDLEAAVDAGRRPRMDHLEFCRATGAELLPLARLRPRPLARLRLRHPLTALWMARSLFRRRAAYDVIVTDSEHVGLPLALMLRAARARTRHVMVVHRVSTSGKRRLVRLAGERGVACYVYHFERCAEVMAELGVPDRRHRHVPYLVDTRFWSPLAVRPQRRICSVGLEFRDYPTLFEAVRGLDVEVDVAAGSPWSQKRDSAATVPVPSNVHTRRRSHTELRELYARSAFTVVPLLENDMQAGITTIVESMAMARAVIVTRTSGQTGTVRNGVTGLEVPPGDPAALREAIRWLLDHPEECRRMGEAGRRHVEAELSLERFVERMTALVSEVASPS